jgi:hypothetical protein
MFMLIRLALLLLTRRWGWMILGAVLIIIGIVLGASSHSVAYQTIDHGTFTPYVVDGGTDYLQTNGSTYYVINEGEMSPAFNGVTVFKNNGTFSMITRTDTQDVDVQLTDGTHLQGTGYKVEKIDVLDSNGTPTQTFVDSEYSQHPNGFYENNWVGGILLIVLGLLAGAAGFFAPQLLKGKLQGLQRSPKAAPAVAGVPGQAGVMSQPNPYAQPYQNPSQYPGYAPGQASYNQPNQQYPAYPQNPQQAYPSYPNYTDPSQYQQPAQPNPPASQPQYPQQPPYQPSPGSYDKTQLANPYDYPDQGR